MKRTATHILKPADLPIAWREAEFAALRCEGDDTYDDRVGESLFSIEDQREEVEAIVRRMMMS